MRSTLWPEARVAELKKLLSQPGMTYDKAAAMFGISRNGIASILRRTRRADYVPRKSPSKARAKLVSKPVPKVSAPVWFGRCKGCGEPKTRNENGTYAAIGKHSNDILRKS